MGAFADDEKKVRRVVGACAGDEASNIDKNGYDENKSSSPSAKSCGSRRSGALVLLASLLPASVFVHVVEAVDDDDHGKKQDDVPAEERRRLKRNRQICKSRTSMVFALTLLVAFMLAAGSMSLLIHRREHRRNAAVGVPTGSVVLQQPQQQQQQRSTDPSFLRSTSSTSTTNNNINNELPTYQQFKMLNFGFEWGHSLFQECRRNILGNQTWGDMRAPFVDKFSVKQILEEVKIPNLKIVPTFAIYRKSNVTKFFENVMTIQQLLRDAGEINRNGIIIKPTHTSGGVARITDDGYYECFKACKKKGRGLMPVFSGATTATSSSIGDSSSLSQDERELAPDTQNEGSETFNPATKMLMHLNMHHNIDTLYWNHLAELQYASIEPGIIVEPSLPFYDTKIDDDMDSRTANEDGGVRGGFREYQWWIINNPNDLLNDADQNPVSIAFVSWWFYHTDPGTGVKSKYIAFYTSDYRPLRSRGYGHMGDGYELVHGSGRSSTLGRKPSTWEMMYQIASDVGRRIVLPFNVGGAVRLDLFASEEEVYFGELTFTSMGCSKPRTPLVIESLMYQIMHGNLSPSQVQPAVVERIVNDRNWALLKNGPKASLSRMDHVETFPSASDLCYKFRHRGEKILNDERRLCLEAAQQVYDMGHQQRCIVAQGRSSTTAQGTLTSFGMPEHPSFEDIMDRVDWQWACGIAVVVLLLHLYHGQWWPATRGDAMAIKKSWKRPSSTSMIPRLSQSFRQWYRQLNPHTEGRFFRVFIYLALVVAYKLMKPNSNGLLNPNETLLGTCVESFKAFVAVHPAHSHYVAFTHLATYWFEVMAWVRASRGFKDMLFWYFMYEVVTSFINEDAHFGHESDVGIKCMRASFIAEYKQYALNDVVRAYLLPPFFCYCYLLPKVICIWAGKALDTFLPHFI